MLVPVPAPRCPGSWHHQLLGHPGSFLLEPPRSERQRTVVVYLQTLIVSVCQSHRNLVLTMKFPVLLEQANSRGGWVSILSFSLVEVLYLVFPPRISQNWSVNGPNTSLFFYLQGSSAAPPSDHLTSRYSPVSPPSDSSDAVTPRIPHSCWAPCFSASLAPTPIHMKESPGVTRTKTSLEFRLEATASTLKNRRITEQQLFRLYHRSESTVLNRRCSRTFWTSDVSLTSTALVCPVELERTWKSLFSAGADCPPSLDVPPL